MARPVGKGCALQNGKEQLSHVETAFPLECMELAARGPTDRYAQRSGVVEER